MFRRLKTSLLTLLRRALRIKIMTTSCEPQFLPPYAEPIGTYVQRLQLLKQVNGLEALRRWQVKQVTAYKSKATSQHEYVSAAVVDPEEKVHFVVFERLRSDPESFTSSDIATSNPLGRVSNSSLSSLSSFSTCPVNDCILPVGPSGKKNPDDVLIYDLLFPQTFPLYELGVLAYMVHQTNTSYLIMTNNCYHFAGTIMKLLEKQHGITDAVHGANAGKWCGINIFRGQDFDKCRPLFENVRKEIQNFVGVFFSAEYLTPTDASSGVS